MSRGEMFQEYEEKRRKEGFFPQLYKAVCNAMGNENIDKLVRQVVMVILWVLTVGFRRQ